MNSVTVFSTFLWVFAAHWVASPSRLTGFCCIWFTKEKRSHPLRHQALQCSRWQGVQSGGCLLPISRQRTVGEAWRVRFCVLRSCVRMGAVRPETAAPGRLSPSRALALLQGPPLTGHSLPAGQRAACPWQRSTYRERRGSWALTTGRVELLRSGRVGSVGGLGFAVVVWRKEGPEGLLPCCPSFPGDAAERRPVCYRRCRRNWPLWTTAPARPLCCWWSPRRLDAS